MAGLGQVTFAAETINAKLTLGERRQAALQAAREGRFDSALPAFVNMVAEAPNDIGIKADYIELLTWAKKYQEALTVAAGMDIKTMPLYSLNALAKAARNTSQFDKAINYYEQLIAREPSNPDPSLGKVLTLIDFGKFVDAESELTKLRHQHPKNTEVLRALSYLGQQSKQSIIVIDANTRLLEINNQDLEAANALIKASREVGAPAPALALAAQYPQAVDNIEIKRIKNDGAAKYIAWGHYSAKTPAERFQDTDVALAKLDEACQCDWSRLDLSIASNRNLMFDRIVALRDRYRMQDVITHYQQLLNAKIDPPTYVLNAAGDAYLYKRMPEEALKAYDASLLKAPESVETKFSKFYTLVDLEQLDAATTLIDELSKNFSAYRQRPKNSTIRPDDYKLEVDSKTFYVRAYGDNLATAEQHFQALNNVGPMNNDVRMALGEIWRWRGWPERAAQRFSEINRNYPDLLQPKINLANTHLDLHDWKVAEGEIKSLAKEYPENASVQALDRRWMLHNERQLTIDTSGSKSSGTTFGSSAQGLNAVLYSSPINYNYRAFVSTQYNHAIFPEGSGNVTYPGIGLEYTNKDWRLTGEVSKASLPNMGVTTAVTADYRFNDQLLFATSLASNTSQMPLRGLKAGINGDLISANTTYRWSDLTRASVGVGYMNIMDGNQRDTLGLAFDRRLITKPHYKLTTHLRVDASHNTGSNVAYFNPERDLDTSVVLDNEWTQWRRYDRSFSHRIQVGTGEYWQKNFGSNRTWMVSYEQQVKLSDRFEIDYGISRSRHAYDGTNELSTQLFTRLNVLF
jgi:biofilm PGA synthesis protein PgaA